MPKEKFNVNDDESVQVHWSKGSQYVSIGVDIGTDIIVVDSHEDGLYVQSAKDLFANFESEKDFNKFLKILKRAGKQAFKK